MLSQTGLINFTAFEDLSKWLLMIRTQAGQDNQYSAGCSPQNFREVSIPEHTKTKLNIPHSSVRTTGKPMPSVPPAQSLSPCSRRNDLPYTKTQKFQEVLLIHSVWSLYYPAQRPTNDLVEQISATAHTRDHPPAAPAPPLQQFPAQGCISKATASKWPQFLLTPHTTHGLASPNIWFSLDSLNSIFTFPFNLATPPPLTTPFEWSAIPNTDRSLLR